MIRYYEPVRELGNLQVERRSFACLYEPLNSFMDHQGSFVC
jgi:hypothetical protein